MKRFRFELDPLLRLARFEYQNELVRLGALTREVANLREREELLQKVLRRESTQRDEDNIVALSEAYRATLADGVRRVELEISRATAQVHECRHQLEQKRQKRDSLEAFEDRRREAWRLEETKREQAELEELASMRAARQRAAARSTVRSER